MMERSERIVVPRPLASPRLAELYERHVVRAVSLAVLLSGDEHAAQDIAHEAFIRAAARLGALRDPSAFDAYLRRTVVNLCRARHRRAAIERAVLSRIALREPRPPSSHPEDRDVLVRALADLPHRQRAAVVLRYYEDLSEERVAETLRCSPRAVNSLVSRAMASLRARLGNERQEEPP